MGRHFQKQISHQSWYLNIIETVWAILNDQLLHMNAITTYGWKNANKGAWGKAQKASINELVECMPCKVKHIIETGYAWVSDH